MRFGRKTKGWAAVGRRWLGDRGTQEDGAVATEERLALLDTPEEDADMMAAPQEMPGMTGDPTQRLLTALGRFQRQVARADGGAPQEMWTEECMRQIITGLEIAFHQGWADVQQALTDTARVLASYEAAASANQCVPFLQDSYEILCLMVGDLIVDNVRSGVLKKWRERYDRALADLAAAGIDLVEDDDAPAAAEAHAPTAGGNGHAAYELPGEAPEDSPFDEAPGGEEEAAAFTTFAGESEPFDAPGGDIPAIDDMIFDAPAGGAEVSVDPIAAPEPEEAPEFFAEPPAVAPEPPPVDAAPEPEPPAEASPEANPAEALLRTTQAAVARGDVADAKLLALQLAVNMARLDVERAELRVRECAAKVNEDEAAIAAAEDAAASVERALQSAEARLAERQAELRQRRDEAGGARDRAAAVSGEIANIDAQIRILQQQRAEQEARLAAMQGELEEFAAAESRLQSELEGLAEEEQDAREALDLARQRLDGLRHRKGQSELAVAAAKDQAARQQAAAEGIEQTLALISRRPPEAPASDGMLF